MLSLKIASLLLTVSFVLSSCATASKAQRDFTIKSAETYFVPEYGPTTLEFNETVLATVEGDDEAAFTILGWTEYTDGEGAINYAMFLGHFRDSLGYRRFDSLVKTLPEKYRELVRSHLETNRRMQAFLNKTKNA